MSDGVITQEKNVFKTVVPCPPGKVCNWDTARDNVRSRMSRAKKTTSQACAEDEFREFERKSPDAVRQKELTLTRNPRIRESGMGKCGKLFVRNSLGTFARSGNKTSM